MTCHYVNFLNSIIFFEDIDFWPKIYLILYPSLENSTTPITCYWSHYHQRIHYHEKLSLWTRVSKKNEWWKVLILLKFCWQYTSNLVSFKIKTNPEFEFFDKNLTVLRLYLNSNDLTLNIFSVIYR